LESIFFSDKDGWTPLTYAAAEGYEEVVDYLLKSGADQDGKFFSDDNEIEADVQKVCILSQKHLCCK